MFKKAISVVLGVLMFLFPAQSAFAQIEVIEFSDESRLIRFKKEDFQDMVDWYAARVSEHEQNVARRDSRGVAMGMCVGASAIHCLAICLILTIVAAVVDDANTDTMLAVGVPLGVLSVLCLMLACYCCSGNRDSAQPVDDEFGQIREIKDWLIRNKVVAGADESSHLLQSAPDCFLLLERPKYKASTDPRPFFTSDRNTDFSQNLINNRFAGLIRDVSSKLRAQGARISDRYCLTKVGNGFERVRGVSIMPEIDSVEVVVDDSSQTIGPDGVCYM